MKLSPCKIVKGKAFNIVQNSNKPLKVLGANLDCIYEIIRSVGEYNRLCFIGSSCMYPQKDSALREEMLGTGEVYEGNAPYSYAKLLGWQTCKAINKEFGLQYFTLIPSDIFGKEGDNHFITEIMMKCHYAKERKESSIKLLGTGTAIRHPLFKEDYERIASEVCETYSSQEPLNLAPPPSFAKSVLSIAIDIQKVTGFDGHIEWDANFSDGQKVKILDNEKLTKLGYGNFTPWMDSLEKAYSEIKNHI